MHRIKHGYSSTVESIPTGQLIANTTSFLTCIIYYVTMNFIILTVCLVSMWSARIFFYISICSVSTKIKKIKIFKKFIKINLTYEFFMFRLLLELYQDNELYSTIIYIL